MPGKLALMHKIQGHSDKLSKETNFNTEECRVLLYIYDRLSQYGPMDRIRLREILHATFDLTDDIMLDLVFKSFDRDNDGYVSDTEWVRALSTMLRGELDQMIEFCYFVYDMNGDGSLAREELNFCLRGCIVSGYGVDPEEVEDAEKDIVEICMKKLDDDEDGQITFEDFRNAVYKDPLLMQAIGPCLPGANEVAAFLALVTEKFRRYTECYGRSWVQRKSQNNKPSAAPTGAHAKPTSFRNFLSENVAHVGGAASGDSFVKSAANKSKGFT